MLESAIYQVSCGDNKLIHTCLTVVMLKVLQQLFVLHDFILGLVQLNPAGTNAGCLAPSTGNDEYCSRNPVFL